MGCARSTAAAADANAAAAAPAADAAAADVVAANAVVAERSQMAAMQVAKLMALTLSRFADVVINQCARTTYNEQIRVAPIIKLALLHDFRCALLRLLLRETQRWLTGQVEPHGVCIMRVVCAMRAADASLQQFTDDLLAAVANARPPLLDMTAMTTSEAKRIFALLTEHDANVGNALLQAHNDLSTRAYFDGEWTFTLWELAGDSVAAIYRDETPWVPPAEWPLAWKACAVCLELDRICDRPYDEGAPLTRYAMCIGSVDYLPAFAAAMGAATRLPSRAEAVRGFRAVTGEASFLADVVPQ